MFTVPIASDGSLEGKVALILNRLPDGAPFVAPKHLAPLVGLTENAFTAHCRNCKALKNWRGSYRFYMDDPGHVDALRSLIKLVLWSGRKLPGDVRPIPANVAKRVH